MICELDRAFLLVSHTTSQFKNVPRTYAVTRMKGDILRKGMTNLTWFKPNLLRISCLYIKNRLEYLNCSTTRQVGHFLS